VRYSCIWSTRGEAQTAAALTAKALFDVEETTPSSRAERPASLRFRRGVAANGAHVTVLDIDADARRACRRGVVSAGPAARGDLVDVKIEQASTRRWAGRYPLGRLDVVFANAEHHGGAGLLNVEGQRISAGWLDPRASRWLWERVMTQPDGRAQHAQRRGTGHEGARWRAPSFATASIAGLRPSAVVGTPT